MLINEFPVYIRLAGRLYKGKASKVFKYIYIVFYIFKVHLSNSAQSQPLLINVSDAYSKCQFLNTLVEILFNNISINNRTEHTKIDNKSYKLFCAHISNAFMKPQLYICVNYYFI